MANPENIAGQGFHTNPERINLAGRPPGIKNRATILKELLELKPDGENTNEVLINKALLDKALEGDLQAIKEVQDTVHGKIVEKSEQIHTFTQMPTVKMGDGQSLDLGDVGSKMKPE